MTLRPASNNSVLHTVTIKIITLQIVIIKIWIICHFTANCFFYYIKIILSLLCQINRPWHYNSIIVSGLSPQHHYHNYTRCKRQHCFKIKQKNPEPLGTNFPSFPYLGEAIEEGLGQALPPPSLTQWVLAGKQSCLPVLHVECHPELRHIDLGPMVQAGVEAFEDGLGGQVQLKHSPTSQCLHNPWATALYTLWISWRYNWNWYSLDDPGSMMLQHFLAPHIDNIQKPATVKVRSQATVS